MRFDSSPRSRILPQGRQGMDRPRLVNGRCQERHLRFAGASRKDERPPARPFVMRSTTLRLGAVQGCYLNGRHGRLDPEAGAVAHGNADKIGGRCCANVDAVSQSEHLTIAGSHRDSDRARMVAIDDCSSDPKLAAMLPSCGVLVHRNDLRCDQPLARREVERYERLVCARQRNRSRSPNAQAVARAPVAPVSPLSPLAPAVPACPAGPVKPRNREGRGRSLGSRSASATCSSRRDR